MIKKYNIDLTICLPFFFLQKQQYQIINTIVIEVITIMTIAHTITIDSWSLSNFHPKTSKVQSKPPEISYITIVLFI